jgi:uncharacterized protein YktA (UPF0223 family)
MAIVWKISCYSTDDVVGEQATSVLQMMQNVKSYFEKKLTAKGIYGIFQRIK